MKQSSQTFTSDNNNSDKLETKNKNLVLAVILIIFCAVTALFLKLLTKIKVSNFKTNNSDSADPIYMETLNFIRKSDIEKDPQITTIITSIPLRANFFDKKSPLKSLVKDEKITGQEKIFQLARENCNLECLEVLLFELAVRSGSVLAVIKLVEAGITTQIANEYDALNQTSKPELEPKMKLLLQQIKVKKALQEKEQKVKCSESTPKSEFSQFYSRSNSTGNNHTTP